ncbi:MAG TPA: hypothetical protein VMA71_00380 [Alloacidobacterium sp.]|nr:hypothetical protein [Alloacidobacterium sp.]
MAKNDPRLIVAVKFHFQMLLFDCKLIRPVLCSFPTGFLIDRQLYLGGAARDNPRRKRIC